MVGMAVSVELFGVPRLLVGERYVTVEPQGSSLADAARALADACPALVGPVLDAVTGWPVDGYTFAVEARFTRDPAATFPPAAALLLVSAQAGG